MNTYVGLVRLLECPHAIGHINNIIRIEAVLQMTLQIDMDFQVVSRANL
jgi:hypothetical protein